MALWLAPASEGGGRRLRWTGMPLAAKEEGSERAARSVWQRSS